MKTSELIEAAQKSLSEHGDLPVYCDFDGLVSESEYAEFRKKRFLSKL